MTILSLKVLLTKLLKAGLKDLPWLVRSGPTFEPEGF